MKSFTHSAPVSTKKKIHSKSNSSKNVARKVPSPHTKLFAYPKPDNSKQKRTQKHQTRRQQNFKDTPINTKLLKFSTENEFEILILAIKLVSKEEYPLEICKCLIGYLSKVQLYQLCDKLLDNTLQTENIKIETMLRADTPATSVISTVLRQRSKQFLLAMCKPILKEIQKRKTPIEIDIAREPSPKVIAKNITILEKIINVMMKGFRKHRTLISDEIKSILKLVWRKCNEMLNGAGWTMVSSFLFLRYICPALASPKNFGLVSDDIEPHHTRGLVLVLKILQGIVSGVHFDGTKETYMTPFNHLIQKHHQQLQCDIVELINSISAPSKNDCVDKFKIKHGKGAKLLCNFYYDYAGKISLHLNEESQKQLFDYLPEKVQERFDDSLYFTTISVSGSSVDEYTEI